jgi:hypothetical protein
VFCASQNVSNHAEWELRWFIEIMKSLKLHNYMATCVPSFVIRENSRFKFQTIETSVHSPCAALKPLNEKDLKPITFLIMPKVGSIVVLRLYFLNNQPPGSMVRYIFCFAKNTPAVANLSRRSHNGEDGGYGGTGTMSGLFQYWFCVF